jgi:2-polyprenyl-6-methoxyphenol hydroxylase-like FAD-dependent oxidoreductase
MAQGGRMAMEDAVVLAEELRAADDIEGALTAFERRRRPRVDWVERQSRAVVESVLLPPAIREAALRERGDPAMRERFRPLLPEP